MPHIHRTLAFSVASALLMQSVPAMATMGPGAQIEDGSSSRAVARAHREAHAVEILQEFRELLKLPNVASDLEGIRRNADAIRARFTARGVPIELLEIDGVPPVIVGRLAVEGAERTLGVYVHYDGQPVQPRFWTFDPWTPTLTDRALEAGGQRIDFPAPGEAVDPEWRLYARASGDDKVPLIAILAALDALNGAQIPLTSNVLFFFEGEEEAGSPHLGQYLAEHRDELDVDAWLICDGPVHPSRRPQLVFGVRGIVSCELTVFGANRSLHSGHYGNWAPNPALELAHLLAGMKATDGSVVIDGFYDDVAPLGEAELRALSALPDVDAALREELGLARTEGGQSLSKRLLLPSFNVRGLAAGGVASEAKNAIPDRAVASIDIRLVRGCKPDKMLDLVEAHLRKEGYRVLDREPTAEERAEFPLLVRMDRKGGYRAARTDMGDPLVRALIAAVERASDDPLVLLPSLGGSLPLYLFQDAWSGPIVIVPMANHDNNQHSPDENIRLANLWYGIELMAEILTMP